MSVSHVRLSGRISHETTRPNCKKFSTGLHVIRGRCSVVWRQCDTLCASGFVDDVTFAHNGLHGTWLRGKKAFPYLIPSVGLRADPVVQAVSPQMTVNHPPGGRLPLLSARPAVTSPGAEHHRPLAGTKLYCLMTDAHRCEQLAQGFYAALPRVGFEPATY